MDLSVRFSQCCQRIRTFVSAPEMSTNLVLLTLIFLTSIVYILMITFNALGGIGYEGLFDQSVGDVSDKFQVYITPAGFTFSIWSVIYIFLGAGAIYSLSSVCRTSRFVGGKVFAQKPVILNWCFYGVLLTNYALNTGWIFVWLYELITAATILLLFIAYTGWIAFAIACYRGSMAMVKKEDGDAKRAVFTELRWHRIIIHNGIALYTTWCTIASLLNLNISIQYLGRCDAEVTSLVCLSVLLAIVVGWFVLENTYFDRYVRYTITQYMVVIFASSGVLTKQMEVDRIDGPVPKSVHILTWIVLGVASGLLVLRLAFVIYRYRTQPLFSDSHQNNPNNKTRTAVAEDSDKKL